jgi:Ca2+:H+ antiporter
VAPQRVNQGELAEGTVAPAAGGDPFSRGPRRRVRRVLERWGGLKLLLLFAPVAVALRAFDAPAGWQFLTALLALLPMAALMGEATEHLAHRAGAGIGGLLNATFGNAAELIIALTLLFKGKDTVVKASLTGSILGNVLLVLGGSLLAGGLRYSTQRFNRTAAGVGATMMVLAAMGLLVPAIFHALPEVLRLEDVQARDVEHHLSLAVSLALFTTYALSLIFSLRTHRDLYNPREESPVDEQPVRGLRSSWSVRRALAVLVGATVFVALASEILSSSIEQAGMQWHMSEVFLGVVVVAIVGNAAEHSSAVLMALKNKMDLAVGIALGSAMQIALFVAPFLVFASYLRAHPMDLLFTTMEVVAVILAVLIARMVAEDGESNWLEGAMLLMVYILLALAFFFLPGE